MYLVTLYLQGILLRIIGSVELYKKLLTHIMALWGVGGPGGAVR
jgi:hypothetical protein